MAKPSIYAAAATAALTVLPCSLTLASPAPAASAEPTASMANTLSEIIVTAQRRKQNLERTPVAVSVLSAKTLQSQQIVTERDLQIAVPGLTVKAGQDSNQLNFSLRGQTVDSFSSSDPAVLPYFNEVAVSTIGSSALYDLQSVQVLKGPQGTLFGRNSTGGAVLFTSTQPTNHFGGYVDETVGNYGLNRTEGAVNLPLVPGVLLVRIAGFLEHREGFQYNLFNGSHPGTVRRNAGRISVTIKPIHGVTDDLVVDYQHAGGSNTTGVVYNILPVSADRAGYPYVPTNVLFTPALDSILGSGAWAAYLAANPGAYPGGVIAFTAVQRQRGPFLVDTNAPDFHRTENTIVTNITKVDLGLNTEFKNIIGYTHLFENDSAEFDGTPFAIDSNGPRGRGGWTRQFSEEPQLLGKAFNRQLSYVLGLYYFDQRQQTHSQSLIVGLEPFIPVTDQINDGVTTDRIYAVYGQGTLDLSQITGVHGLSFTIGGRLSSERVQFTHLADDTYVTSPVPTGAVYVNPLKDTFKNFSWDIGFNDQLDKNLMVYIVSRRSFRSGGFNFFAPPLPGFGNQGGAEFRPETATDVEAGSKFQGTLDGMPARLNVAAYNTWILNIQRSNYVSIFGALAGITVNVPEAEVRGVEIDGTVKPANFLTLGGSLNFTDARFTSNLVSVLGNPAVAFGPYPDTSKWSGNLYAEVSAPLGPHFIGSLRGDFYAQTSQYFSSTDNTLNPGTEIAGYGIANFRLAVESENGAWTVSANVQNAFDHVYYVGGVGFASLFAVNIAVPGPPRTYTLEVRYDF